MSAPAWWANNEDHPVPAEIDAYIAGLLAEEAEEQRHQTQRASALALSGLCCICGRHDRKGMGLTCLDPVCVAALADWPQREIFALREVIDGATPAATLVDRWGMRVALALMGMAVLVEVYLVWWSQHGGPVMTR